MKPDKQTARLLAQEVRIRELSDEVLGLKFRIIDLRAALVLMTTAYAMVPAEYRNGEPPAVAREAVEAVAHIPEQLT